MSETTRRDFLRGKAAADAVGEAVERVLPDDTLGADDLLHGGLTMRISRRAMACQFELCLSMLEYPNATDLAIEVLDLVDALEEQLSFFRATSELTRINLLAADEAMEVEPRLFDLLCLAEDIYRDTDGAFDLTSTPLWELWGFSRRTGNLPTQQQIDETLPAVGMQHVRLDRQQRTVRFDRPGVRLNLGAIGKGYALDRCAEKLAELHVDHYLISGGFSSMLARGRPLGGEATGGGWSVGLRNPLRPDRRLGELRLRDRALATSGSYIQSFRFGGKRYGHIIDPRTGWPAENVLSTTVLAPTAAVADALSTAFYVLGLEKTEAYCRAHPDIGVVLIEPARTRGGLALHTIGLSHDDVQIYFPAEEL